MKGRYSDLEKKSKNLLFSGVLILTLSNILVKAIGLLYKIPLQNLIHDEGMGYFNAAYRIYTLFYMVSTAGLPVAVSRMVSESRAKGNRKEVKAIIRSALLLFTVVGFVGTTIMAVGSKWFASLLAMENSYLSILAVAPTLFFICICSALRGYFQGYQNMVPTAVSEVLEALGKLGLGILFALYALKKGYDIPTVAAYTIFGLTIGVVVGTLYTIVHKIFFKTEKYDAEFGDLGEDVQARTTGALMKAILSISIPIMLSSVVMTLADTIDVALISRRLQDIGYAEKVATAKYGNYSTLAVPLFNLPPILIYPISASIVPYISAALAQKDTEKVRETMTRSLKVASLIAIPSALGLAVFSKPILSLLYRDVNSVEMAHPLLTVLAPAVFFLGMISVTNAILQATKHERLPIISMAAGSLVKIASSYFLIGNKSIEIFGAPIGTFLCYLTISLLNFIFIVKYTGMLPEFGKVFFRPFLSSVICVLSAFGVYKLLSVRFTRLATLLAIAFAVLVYVIAIFLTKAITEDDVMMLPKGEKLTKLLKKLKLIRG